MAHSSKPTNAARKTYHPQSGTKAKISIACPPMLAIVIPLLMATSIGSRSSHAQSPSAFSAQQSYLNKLVQLQTTIDAADTEIKNQMFSARADIAQLDLARLGKNIEADTEIKNRLNTLAADIAITAIRWPTLPPPEQLHKLADFASDYADIGKKLLVAYQDDAAARQRIGQVGQKLTIANTTMTRLSQLKLDRARLASEGQQAGLLPNVSYDAKNDRFSVTSPQRPQAVPSTARASVAQVAQATTTSATSQPATGSFVIPTTPDTLALALLYETYIGYLDPSNIERKSTLKAAIAFSKCMIEHRTTNVMRPNELWEFLTHSADILRAKNALASYWPIAQRLRTFPNQKEFEFVIAKRTLPLSKLTMNALNPSSLHVMGITYEITMNQVNQMGFSDPDVCVAPPSRERSRQPAADDEAIVLPN